MNFGIIKTLIIGSALALLFVCGAFVNANAQFRAGVPQTTCQGSYSYGPTTPAPFGSVGGAGGG